jgi:hypothetical protein
VGKVDKGRSDTLYGRSLCMTGFFLHRSTKPSIPRVSLPVASPGARAYASEAALVLTGPGGAADVAGDADDVVAACGTRVSVAASVRGMNGDIRSLAALQSERATQHWGNWAAVMQPVARASRAAVVVDLGTDTLCVRGSTSVREEGTMRGRTRTGPGRGRRRRGRAGRGRRRMRAW